MRELCNGKFYEFRKRECYEPMHDYFYDVEKKVFFDWGVDGNYYHGYNVNFYTLPKEGIIEEYNEKHNVPDELALIETLEEIPLSDSERAHIASFRNIGWTGVIPRCGGIFDNYRPDYSFDAAVIPEVYK